MMLTAVNKEEIKFNFKEVIVYVLKSLIQIKQFNWHLSFTDNVKNSLSWGTLKRHISSIGVFVVYIDTGSPVPNIPSKSRVLTDENKKILKEWKWFEATVFVWNIMYCIIIYVILCIIIIWMLEVTKKNFKIRKSALIHGYLNLWFQKENYITLDLDFHYFSELQNPRKYEYNE